MSKYNRSSSDERFSGMQDPTLIVDEDHPVWGRLAKQFAKDDKRLGDVEVTADDMLEYMRAAEKLGDLEGLELGRAFLRVLANRGEM